MIKVKRIYFKKYDQNMRHTQEKAGYKDFSGEYAIIDANSYAGRNNLYKYDIKILFKNETKKINRIAKEINKKIENFTFKKDEDSKEYSIELRYYIVTEDGKEEKYIDVSACHIETQEMTTLYEWSYNNFSEDEIKILFSKIKNEKTKIENLGVCAV